MLKNENNISPASSLSRLALAIIAGSAKVKLLRLNTTNVYPMYILTNVNHLYTVSDPVVSSMSHA